MAVESEDIRYLNRFLGEVWPGISEILHSEMTHRAFSEIERQPVRMSRRRTRLDLSATPGFAVDPQGSLVLRIPESGKIRFSSRLFLLPRLPWPRLNFEVDIAIETRIRADAEPATEFDVDVRSNWVGSLIGRWINWQDMIRKQFEGDDFERELGYFSLARYSPSEVPEIPPAELVSEGSPLLDGAINLVLVPESFPGDDLARFDAAVDAVVKVLKEPDSSHANEPFHSFRTAINVWTIKPVQSPDGDHLMGAFRDPRGHRRVALANLARLAAIGHAADTLGPGQTYLAFVVNPDAPRFEGNRPNAMALGNVVLQPLQSTPQEDAWLLLHELGHTSLGRLGDEYVLGSRRDDRYLGLPPRQPNLASTSDSEKWRRWVDGTWHLPEWDRHPIHGVEGGGYFARNISRPAEECAMKSSKEGIPFCAVCREALTKGFRSALGSAQIILCVTYSTGEEFDVLATGATASKVPVRQSGSGEGGARVTITTVAGTLPEPWSISAHIVGQGSVDVEHGGPDGHPTILADALTGDRLHVTVVSTCPFTPWDESPSVEAEIVFVPGA